MPNNHPSVQEMWDRYSLTMNESPKNTTYEAWHFCYDEANANELADLVLEGTKRATASLHLLYEIENEKLPQPGDHDIIINWAGIAKCIIKTTDVRVIPFNEVSKEFAFREGEGDKSLDYWQKVHKLFFSKELTDLGKEFKEDMPIVCQEFELIYY